MKGVRRRHTGEAGFRQKQVAQSVIRVGSRGDGYRCQSAVSVVKPKKVSFRLLQFSQQSRKQWSYILAPAVSACSWGLEQSTGVGQVKRG